MSMKTRTCKDKSWAHIKKAVWTFGEGIYQDIPVHLSLIDILENDCPIRVEHGYGRIYINAPGIKWLQVIPVEQPYWLTAMFEEDGSFLQLYIDIVSSIDFTDPTDPKMSDMYLDIILEQDREIYLVDRDELDKALQNEEIGERQYDKAIADAGRMVSWLQSHKEEMISALLSWYGELHRKQQKTDDICR